MFKTVFYLANIPFIKRNNFGQHQDKRNSEFIKQQRVQHIRSDNKVSSPRISLVPTHSLLPPSHFSTALISTFPWVATPKEQHQLTLREDKGSDFPEEFKNLLLALPKEQGWRTHHLYQYQGCWFHANELQRCNLSSETLSSTRL